MSKISMHIGHRIRNLRKKKGYTIEEFSKIINKSKATLSKYENGSISMDIDTILEIAEALEVEIDYLINYKSPRVNKTLSLRNSYFNCSNFYVYFYDGRFKKIVRSLLVLSQRSPSSNSANATLYKGVSNFSDYANCDNVFKGTLNVYDTTSYATLINQVNKAKRVFLTLTNPMARGLPAMGLFVGVSNPPFFSPMSIKVIVSRYILEEDEVFNNIMAVSKEDVKQLKQYNMMLVNTSDCENLSTK